MLKKRLGCYINDTDDLFELHVSYIEIAPRFNKDGWYIDTKTKRCWIEYTGKAYYNINEQQEYESFCYKLKLYDNLFLNKEQHLMYQFLAKQNNKTLALLPIKTRENIKSYKDWLFYKKQVEQQRAQDKKHSFWWFY